MQAHKPQQSFGCSLCNSYGFTLAETMIVIVVLGIIATLTIPALVNKNKESVAKTKVRKAMAAYESALNKMIIENDLKSDDTLAAWAGDAENNCANSSNYFKKVQGDGCIFKTSDGIWWDISNIERPLIAFKDTDLTQDKANSTTDMSAFVLVGRFGTDGSLRVDDLAYETANSETVNNYKSYDQVAKLYNFLNGKKSSGGEETSEYTFASQRQKYINGDFSTSCQELYGNNIDCSNRTCKSCSVYDGSGDGFLVFDEKGNVLLSAFDCRKNYKDCKTEGIGDNFSTENFSIEYACDENLNCFESHVYDRRDNMEITWNCDGDGGNCNSIGRIEIIGDNGAIFECYGCNLDASICDPNFGCDIDPGSSNLNDSELETEFNKYFEPKTNPETGQTYRSLKEQYRPTRNSNLTYSE